MRKASLMSAMTLLAGALAGSRDDPWASLGALSAAPAWSPMPLGHGKSDLQGLRRRTLKRAAKDRARRPMVKASRRRNRH